MKLSVFSSVNICPWADIGFECPLNKRPVILGGALIFAPTPMLCSNYNVI
jgi:hypothetical protein